jgi:formiminotetrahydrofolate cyclodeaminase
MPIGQFMEKLASSDPTPGGGSAAALCGALSAALCCMTAGVTLKHEKFKSVWELMAGIEKGARELMTRFQELADKDMAAYEDVLAAFRLPKQSEEEKALRQQAIQIAYQTAADVPLQTLRLAEKAGRCARIAIDSGNPNAFSDAAAALHLARNAAEIAADNIAVNMESIKDAEFLENTRREMNWLLETIRTRYSQARPFLPANRPFN